MLQDHYYILRIILYILIKEIITNLKFLKYHIIFIKKYLIPLSTLLDYDKINNLIVNYFSFYIHHFLIF